MAKHHHIIATYRLNAEEMLQVSIPIINSYPDSLNQAKIEAVDAIMRMHANAVALEAQTRSDADNT
jgi:hypothetical protein